MPDPRVTPHLKSIMRETENNSRLTSFFAFFAKMKDDDASLETLDRFAKLTADDLATIKDKKQQAGCREFTGYLVDEMRKTADKTKPKNAQITDRLKKLAETYPSRKGA